MDKWRIKRRRLKVKTIRARKAEKIYGRVEWSVKREGSSKEEEREQKVLLE